MLPDHLPRSRVPDPAEAPPLGWGVIGTGWIAERFVDALQSMTRQQVVAVGSRTDEGAAAFARRFGIQRAHGSYESLVGDSEVEVVYVATPHPSHLPHGLLTLDAGKHVLIEKPIALNAREARQLKARATELDLYCAEAMWTLFTPKFDVIRQILDAGMLGEVRTVIVDFGEWFADDHRIMRPDLAGGPLLDLGSYPLSLAHWILGAPTEVIARGIPAPSGVNGQASVLMVHAGDAHSVITTSIFSNTPTGATIAGTEGTITIPGIYYRPGKFTVASSDHQTTHTYEEPPANYTYLAYEAAETARRIVAGEKSTPYRPMADSVSTMEIIDEVRRQIGIVFPGERGGAKEPTV
jgi:predicted dehydrogenase